MDCSSLVAIFQTTTFMDCLSIHSDRCHRKELFRYVRYLLTPISTGGILLIQNHADYSCVDLLISI